MARNSRATRVLGLIAAGYDDRQIHAITAWPIPLIRDLRTHAATPQDGTADTHARTGTPRTRGRQA